MSADFKFPEFIRNQPEIDLPLSGARGWLMQSQSKQAVFMAFAETVEVPEHSHEDQWELPMAGKVELHREGKTETFGPGDRFFVPAGQAHGATVHAGYQAIVFFDTPNRYSPR